MTSICTHLRHDHKIDKVFNLLTDSFADESFFFFFFYYFSSSIVKVSISAELNIHK